jgi:hypothetical protein
MTMGRYREKIHEVEALQWSGSNWHQVLQFVKWDGGVEIWPDRGGGVNFVDKGEEVRVEESEWIVKDVVGFMKLDDATFTANFELIDEEEDE